jgi:hypothetical protein
MAELSAVITKIEISTAVFCLDQTTFEAYADADGSADVEFDGTTSPGAWLYNNGSGLAIVPDINSPTPPPLAVRPKSLTNDINPNQGVNVLNLGYDFLINNLVTDPNTHLVYGTGIVDASVTYLGWYEITVDTKTYYLPMSNNLVPLKLTLWKTITYNIGEVETTVYQLVPEEIMLNACAPYNFGNGMVLNRRTGDSGYIRVGETIFTSGDTLNNMPGAVQMYDEIGASIKIWETKEAFINELVPAASRKAANIPISGGGIGKPPYQPDQPVDNSRYIRLGVEPLRDGTPLLHTLYPETVAVMSPSVQELIPGSSPATYFKFSGDYAVEHARYFPHYTTLLDLKHEPPLSGNLPRATGLTGWKIYIETSELNHVIGYDHYSYLPQSFMETASLIAVGVSQAPTVEIDKTLFITLESLYSYGSAENGPVSEIPISVDTIHDLVWDEACYLRIKLGAGLRFYNAATAQWQLVTFAEDQVIDLKLPENISEPSGIFSTKPTLKFRLGQIARAILTAFGELEAMPSPTAPVRVECELSVTYAYDTGATPTPPAPVTITEDIVIYMNMLGAITCDLRGGMDVDPNDPTLLVGPSAIVVTTMLYTAEAGLQKHLNNSATSGFNRDVIDTITDGDGAHYVWKDKNLGAHSLIGGINGTPLYDHYLLQGSINLTLDGEDHIVKGNVYSDFLGSGGTVGYVLELFRYAKVWEAGLSYPQETKHATNLDANIGLISQVRYVEPE